MAVRKTKSSPKKIVASAPVRSSLSSSVSKVSASDSVPVSTRLSVILGYIGAAGALLFLIMPYSLLSPPYAGLIGFLSGIGAIFLSLSGHKSNPVGNVWILGLVLGIGTVIFIGGVGLFLLSWIFS